jgi:hypothetical protein
MVVQTVQTMLDGAAAPAYVHITYVYNRGDWIDRQFGLTHLTAYHGTPEDLREWLQADRKREVRSQGISHGGLAVGRSNQYTTVGKGLHCLGDRYDCRRVYLHTCYCVPGDTETEEQFKAAKAKDMAAEERYYSIPHMLMTAAKEKAKRKARKATTRKSRKRNKR